ncbi:MAG: hypothetical protein CMH27_07340 [Micavibrio sp.]|nr:hypothetical protein [Micavibrio sp.]
MNHETPLVCLAGFCVGRFSRYGREASNWVSAGHMRLECFVAVLFRLCLPAFGVFIPPAWH